MYLENNFKSEFYLESFYRDNSKLIYPTNSILPDVVT